MTATLKHVANQYILIVDERPKIGEWYLDDTSQIRINYINGYNYWLTRPNYKCIIAAENLDGVKGIALRLDDRIITDIELISDFFNEYRFSDTEVEVTEEKDYYLIRL